MFYRKSIPPLPEWWRWNTDDGACVDGVGAMVGDESPGDGVGIGVGVTGNGGFVSGGAKVGVVGGGVEVGDSFRLADGVTIGAFAVGGWEISEIPGGWAVVGHDGVPGTVV